MIKLSKIYMSIKIRFNRTRAILFVTIALLLFKITVSVNYVGASV